MKKVNKPQREKIVTLEEKKLTAAKGSSGYMVAWGFVGDGEENGGSGEGSGNP